MLTKSNSSTSRDGPSAFLQYVEATSASMWLPRIPSTIKGHDKSPFRSQRLHDLDPCPGRSRLHLWSV